MPRMSDLFSLMQWGAVTAMLQCPAVIDQARARAFGKFFAQV
jgi:hypothetical protein